jgi:hypothetical protein
LLRGVGSKQLADGGDDGFIARTHARRVRHREACGDCAFGNMRESSR